jgi:hypothetical protein
MARICFLGAPASISAYAAAGVETALAGADSVVHAMLVGGH